LTKSISTESFTTGERDFLLDGKPFQIRYGEMHFARIPSEYWGGSSPSPATDFKTAISL
jgi:hypothetical protein